MNLPKISFFDDPRSVLWVREILQTCDPIISGSLIQNRKRGGQKESNYFIEDGKLGYKNKHIDLENVTLEKTKNNGFKLSRNRIYVELFAHNE